MQSLKQQDFWKQSKPENKDNPKVEIHADGGCEPNPGIGGWAAIIVTHDGNQIEIAGSERETTNNRMELRAGIEAFKALQQPCNVWFYSDSKYVIDGITSWIIKWMMNSWRRGKKRDAKAILNVDLWKELEAESSRHQVQWRWVKGHNGNKNNERCDYLARQAIKGVNLSNRNW